MSDNQTITELRARYAALSRHRDANDPAIAVAKARLKAELITARALELSIDAPPLSIRQRDIIISAFAGLTISGGETDGRISAK